jgi:hypothetical protein
LEDKKKKKKDKMHHRKIGSPGSEIAMGIAGGEKAGQLGPC